MFRVLVLEDDDDLREILGELLPPLCGGEALTTRSLSELQEHSGDALQCRFAILDVNLGHGEPTGVDAARWLRARGFREPIMFLTGHARASPRLSEACGELHAVLFEKPVEVNLLRDFFGRGDCVTG